MKNLKHSVVSILLVIAMLSAAFAMMVVPTVAAASEGPAVKLQSASEWKNSNYVGDSLYNSGSGILAFANAVNYLSFKNGRGNVDCDVNGIAEWAASRGYYSYSGVNRSFFAGAEFRCGEDYKFATVNPGRSGDWSDAALKSHLKDGGVAIGNVGSSSVANHYVAIVDYNEANDSFLIYDSLPAASRGTDSGNPVWMTSAQLNSHSQKNGMVLHWFCLYSPRVSTDSLPDPVPVRELSSGDEYYGFHAIIHVKTEYSYGNDLNLSINADNKVVTAQANASDSKQIWYFESDNDDGIYRIINVTNGLVIRPQDDSTGDYMEMYVQEDPDWAVAHWYLRKDTDGSYYLTSARHETMMKNLDVSWGQAGKVQFYPYSEEEKEKYTVTIVNPPYINAVEKRTEVTTEEFGKDFYAHIRTFSTYIGNSQQYQNKSLSLTVGSSEYLTTALPNVTDTKQIWHFQYSQTVGTTAYYKILNVSNNLYMDVAAGEENSLVKFSSNGNADTALWAIKKDGSGYLLSPKSSPLYNLDISRGTPSKVHKYPAKVDEKEVLSINPLPATYATDLGDSFYAQIKSKSTSMVLGYNSNSDLALVADQNYTEQLFKFDKNADGTYVITNAEKPEFCLALSSGKTASGTKVVLASKETAEAKDWFLYKLSDGSYQIRPKSALKNAIDATDSPTLKSNFAAEIGAQAFLLEKMSVDDTQTNPNSNNSAAPSAGAPANLGSEFYARINATTTYFDVSNPAISIKTNNNAGTAQTDTSDEKQIWHFVRLDDGSYKIENKYNGLALTVMDGGTTNNTLVHVTDYSDSSSQHWFVVPNDAGYLIQPKNAPTADLDISGGEKYKVQIWHFSAADKEVFTITKTECIHHYGDFIQKEENGEYTHYKVCDGCGNISESGKCSGAQSATCTAPAVCDTCNKAYGNSLGHSYGAYTQFEKSGEKYHHQKCERTDCDAKQNEEKCHDGTATCQELAECIDCKKTYGVKADHNYAPGWGYKGEDGHAHVCQTENCEEHDAVKQHEFGTDDICDTCEYERDHVHSWEDDWTKSDSKHWYACGGCEEKQNPEDHIYPNGSDTCNKCGYTREHADNHTFGDTWNYDATGHWYECRCGKKNEFSEHIFGTDDICDICKYERKHVHAYGTTWKTNANEHWKECACTAHDSTAPHIFGTGDICDICEYERAHVHAYGTTWTNDEQSHWNECVCKEKSNTAEHDFGTNDKCDVCEYERQHVHVFGTEWKSDVNGHWNECYCGEKKEAEVHEFGSDDTCDICQYEREHVHTFGTAWENDVNQHWNTCTCGEKDNRSAHEFNSNGVCSICAYEKPHVHTYESEWKSGSDGHWNECACGEKSSVSEHEFGSDDICDICDYQRPHSHSFGLEWQSDENTHWMACACGVVTSQAEHTYDENNSCTVCGQKTDKQKETEAPPEEPTETETMQYLPVAKSSGCGGCGGTVSAGVAVISAVIAMGAMAIGKKKKED